MKFGIIGNPVSHSQSPILFAEVFGGKYQYDRIEEPDFEKAYGKFLEEYEAVNVTMPFKELAYYKSYPGSDAVRAIKAVNILKKEGERVVGYNSDYLGVKAVLEKEGMAASRALIVGCGGAAKAAAVAAVDAGCSVTMTNRSYEKCYSFVRHCDRDLRAVEPGRVRMEDFDSIIYAVPVAIDNLQGWSFAAKIVLEANYANPVLRQKTINDGGRYLEGILWLKAQADTGYKIFLPDEEPQKRLYL